MKPRFVVDVALVPVYTNATHGPILEVEIIPVTELRRLQQLRTLGEMHARPRAVPKLQTKLDRAISKKVARLEDAAKLRAWAAAVKERDQWKDRKTGVRVRSTRALDPLRAEAHHIEPKANRATRYDIRNGITLSYEHHFDVEHYTYRIEGTVWFVKDGCRYIDGTYPVTFVRL